MICETVEIPDYLHGFELQQWFVDPPRPICGLICSVNMTQKGFRTDFKQVLKTICWKNWVLKDVSNRITSFALLETGKYRCKSIRKHVFGENALVHWDAVENVGKSTQKSHATTFSGLDGKALGWPYICISIYLYIYIRMEPEKPIQISGN